MAPLDAKQFRFWRALRSIGLKRVVVAADFFLASLFGGLGTFLYLRGQASVDAHTALAGDFLTIGATLFGIAIAGFAIIATLLGERYGRLLERSNVSAYDLLRHFLVEAGILVGSIAATVAFRAFASALFSVDPTWEQTALGVTAFMFFWGLFGALELMKLVLGVAVTSSSLFNQSDEPPSRQSQAG
jgi:hypothetical protein